MSCYLHILFKVATHNLSPSRRGHQQTVTPQTHRLDRILSRDRVVKKPLPKLRQISIEQIVSHRLHVQTYCATPAWNYKLPCCGAKEHCETGSNKSQRLECLDNEGHLRDLSFIMHLFLTRFGSCCTTFAFCHTRRAGTRSPKFKMHTLRKHMQACWPQTSRTCLRSHRKRRTHPSSDGLTHVGLIRYIHVLVGAQNRTDTNR
jgi:hypothetical protein